MHAPPPQPTVSPPIAYMVRHQHHNCPKPSYNKGQWESTKIQNLCGNGVSYADPREEKVSVTKEDGVECFGRVYLEWWVSYQAGWCTLVVTIYFTQYKGSSPITRPAVRSAQTPAGLK